jgi:hypothetical protein
VGRLVGALSGDTNVIGLLLGQLGELDTERSKVEAGDLFVEVLGKDVHLASLVFAGLALGPQLDLSEGLVGKGGRHHEGRVASGTSQVQETTHGKDDDAMAIGEHKAIHLGLDVDNSAHGSDTTNVNLVIEVTNVSNNGVVLHTSHVRSHDDILVTSSGDKNIREAHDSAQSNDGESLHGGLKGADGINLGHVDNAASSLQGLGASLSDVTISAHDAALAGNHDVSSTAESIRKGVLASVKVVELALGDRVVHVDGREEELLLLGHHIKSVHTSGGLLRDTDHAGSNLLPLGGVLGEQSSEDAQHALHLGVGGGLGVGQAAVNGVLLLVLDTLVDEEGHITSIIDDHVGSITTLVLLPLDGVQGALPVLLKSLALPGEDSGRSVTGNGGGGVVLGGVDVATAPTHSGTESLEGLDKDGSLNGHVEGSSDSAVLEEGVAVLASARHQTGHFEFSNFDFLTTEVGKTDISNLKVSRGHCYKVLS